MDTIKPKKVNLLRKIHKRLSKINEIKVIYVFGVVTTSVLVGIYGRLSVHPLIGMMIGIIPGVIWPVLFPIASGVYIVDNLNHWVIRY